MTDARARRRRLVADIVRSGQVASQEDVATHLAGQGLQVTQATVSRDLEQLGAVKVRRGGAMRYALPHQVNGGDGSADRLQRILAEWVQSVEAAGTLLVLRTPPGSANIVASTIDQAGLPEVAGTVSGDDTLFVALRDGVVADAVAHKFRSLVHYLPQPY